ncbi:MAG: sensor histidine kinase [Anaerolineae bacterium]
MKELQALRERIAHPDQDIREARPFYFILTLVIVVIYGWSLVFTPRLLDPVVLIAFTALVVVHTALHWLSPYLAGESRWFLPYLIVQAAFVFGITLISGNQGITLGLYLGLAGETVGMLEDLRKSAIPVIALMTLCGLNYAWGWGAQEIGWWIVTIVPMVFFVVIYVSMFVRQARERQRAQSLLHELESAHRQLAEYAARVEDLTRVAERQRMARELHDTLAQGLAGVILQLEAAQGQLERGDQQKVALIVGQAQERARAALAEARRAIDDLRAQTAGAPFAENIRAEADRFSAATGIPCAVQFPADLVVPEASAEHVRRFFSEGLTNVARHARATVVTISARAVAGRLRLEICDDGAGFDPAAAMQTPGHYGLLGLHERARLAGGTVEIDSRAGAGTRLAMVLPLEARG